MHFRLYLLSYHQLKCSVAAACLSCAAAQSGQCPQTWQQAGKGTTLSGGGPVYLEERGPGEGELVPHVPPHLDTTVRVTATCYRLPGPPCPPPCPPLSALSAARRDGRPAAAPDSIYYTNAIGFKIQNPFNPSQYEAAAATYRPAQQHRLGLRPDHEYLSQQGSQAW